MRLLRTLAFAALAGAALSGCIVHARGPRYGTAVVIPAGHVHTARCGHFYYRGAWYHCPDHVHGPGCGHIFKGGIWIVVD